MIDKKILDAILKDLVNGEITVDTASRYIYWNMGCGSDGKAN